MPDFDLDLSQSGLLTLALLTSFVAGLVRGTVGFGGPAIMMLVLTQFYAPASVVVVVIMADYTASLQFAYGALRNAAWSFLTPVLVATFVGLPFGIYVLEAADPDMLKRGIAAVAGFCTLLMLTGWRFKTTPSLPLIAAAGIGGGAIVGATFIALPIMIFIFAAPGSAVTTRATALAWGVVTSSALLVIYYLRDIFTLSDLGPAVMMTVSYVLGAAAGALVFKSLSEILFRRSAIAVLLVLSAIGLLT